MIGPDTRPMVVTVFVMVLTTPMLGAWVWVRLCDANEL